MDYKQTTRQAYDTYTDIFDRKFGEHFAQSVQPHADKFIIALKGKRVLDLGSGPGNHGEYFSSKGLDVLCVDYSPKMVEFCKKRGLKAQVGDIEDLDLPDGVFDGVWMYTSLLHVPRAKVPAVLERIMRLLSLGGLFGLAVKEGEGEGLEPNEKYPGTRRWFTYFMDEEIRAFAAPHFELLSFNKDTVGSSVYLSYLFRLKA